MKEFVKSAGNLLIWLINKITTREGQVVVAEFNAAYDKILDVLDEDIL